MKSWKGLEDKREELRTLAIIIRAENEKCNVLPLPKDFVNIKDTDRRLMALVHELVNNYHLDYNFVRETWSILL